METCEVVAKAMRRIVALRKRDRDDLTAAIARVKAVTEDGEPWTAWSLWNGIADPAGTDPAIATILNAVVDGRLVTAEQALSPQPDTVTEDGE